MKVQLQLSMEHTLRDRLKNISKQTSIPMAKIVSDLLGAHLGEVEARHEVQPRLPLQDSTPPAEVNK